jgi:hypothetical protein
MIRTKAVLTGARSLIANEFVCELNFTTSRFIDATRISVSAGELVPLDAEVYLLCHGMLLPKRFSDQTEEERRQSWFMNYDSHRKIIDAVMEANPIARVCVIGSESGYRGSFDDGYAMAKMLLHDYVETKRLPYPGQQLFAISPGIISDCGMTTRRLDQDRVAERIASHRKGEAVTALQVAKLAAHVIAHQPFISGTVIRMHGENR